MLNSKIVLNYFSILLNCIDGPTQRVYDLLDTLKILSAQYRINSSSVGALSSDSHYKKFACSFSLIVVFLNFYCCYFYLVT
jgi:hypothetical protein